MTGSVLLVGIPGQALAQATTGQIPENAEPRSYGDGWRCNPGYRESNDACAAIEIPRTGTRQVPLSGRDGNAVTASRNPIVPAHRFEFRRTHTSTTRKTDGTAINLTVSGMANMFYLDTPSTLGTVN
jgi:hypothetical protein